MKRKFLRKDQILPFLIISRKPFPKFCDFSFQINRNEYQKIGESMNFSLKVAFYWSSIMPSFFIHSITWYGLFTQRKKPLRQIMRNDNFPIFHISSLYFLLFLNIPIFCPISYFSIFKHEQLFGRVSNIL